LEAPHAGPASEELIFDKDKQRMIPQSSWVYTGSTFLESGRYLAEVDGVVIGFVHSPAPLIESVAGAGIGQYGSIVLNPNLGLAPGAKVTLIVRALTTPK
jgi:hypothetical protein